jgi:monoamine oxidase
MATQRSIDLVIVGAGAAGLGAARRASELGLTFVLCEAMDRIGGRAYTETSTFGTPWDHGCHWLHSGSVNLFAKLADQYGFHYLTSTPARCSFDGRRWLAETERAEVDRQVFDGLWGRIKQAGEQGRDVSAAEVVDMNHPLISLLRTALAAEWSVDIAQVSTADDAAYRDTDENWPVEEGYGALVARHAQGIPVELNTPVTRIRWDGPGVVVETPSGAIDARVAVVTVSTRVIQDEVIDFLPALPDWKRDAYAAITLGNANKVSYKIDRNLLGEEHNTAFIQMTADQGMWFQLRPFGKDMANGYIAGSLGAQVEAEREAALIATGRQALASAFGSDILKAIQVEATTMWQHEPWIRGAYGAAQPGKAHLRRDLATPIDDRLFFAGEATSPDFFSTCHGAHLSGVAAVEAAEVAIRPRVA